MQPFFNTVHCIHNLINIFSVRTMTLCSFVQPNDKGKKKWKINFALRWSQDTLYELVYLAYPYLCWRAFVSDWYCFITWRARWLIRQNHLERCRNCSEKGAIKKYLADDRTNHLSITVYHRLTSTSQINSWKAPSTEEPVGTVNQTLTKSSWEKSTYASHWEKPLALCLLIFQ